MPALAILPNMGPVELIIIFAILVLVVGVGKLGDIGGALGRGIREFRLASKDDTPKQLPEETASERRSTPEGSEKGGTVRH